MTTRYLLDTCVLSEFVKPKPERKVIDWLNAVDMAKRKVSWTP